MKFSLQARCPAGMLLPVKMKCLCAYLHAGSWKHKSLNGIRFKTQFRHMQYFLMFKFTEFLRIINSADDPLQGTVRMYARTVFLLSRLSYIKT
jgi:hypothetical protein